MTRAILFSIAIVVAASTSSISQDSPPSTSDPVPVLVELFTSEGCSSCPPADHFLESLDAQPIAGINMVVLSEHVDYWDHQGWQDRFSSPAFTERQKIYGWQFKLPDVYTPQLVIDGRRQVSGGNMAEAEAALREAQTHPKVALRITRATLDHGRIGAHLESVPFNLPSLSSLDVYIAIALNHAESQVARGENANRRLTHTAVARKITQIGKLKAGEQFSRDFDMKTPSESDLANLRIVAFLQDPKSRTVFGATMKRVGETRASSASGSSAVTSPQPSQR